jgi:transcriptional regulator with XRE-family HTH domain
LIADARKAKGWSETDLVHAAGFRNVQKGLRRLRSLESGRDLLPATQRYALFAKALGLSDDQVLLALASDFEEMDEPLPPRVIIRWLPAFYGQLALPDGCTVEEAVRLAEQFSRTKGYRTCVVLSRLRALYVEPDGSRKQMCGLPGSTCPLSAELVDKIELKLRLRLGETPVELPPNDG